MQEDTELTMTDFGRFDFVGKRTIALIISTVLIVISIASLATRGLQLGLDFTGGYQIEVGAEQPLELVPMRQALIDAGIEDAQVQYFGSRNEVLVRLATEGDRADADVSASVREALQTASESPLEMRRVEFVGPQVGAELRDQGGLAVIYALFGIVVYIWFRFEKKFAVGSVAALTHDVILTLGVFSLLGLDFDLSVLAAILAVIGYSLNDTIVVFDRIRETFLRYRDGTASQIVNLAVNQTLSRTVVTSMTTLLVLLALYFLGTEVILGFATALIIGVIVGTYSSIYIASTITLMLGISRSDLIVPVVDENEAEQLDP